MHFSTRAFSKTHNGTLSVVTRISKAMRAMRTLKSQRVSLPVPTLGEAKQCHYWADEEPETIRLRISSERHIILTTEASMTSRAEGTVSLRGG